MNPFIISGFHGEEIFCDRKSELEKLLNAFENGRNVTLCSLRRMGKSCLVKYLFFKLKDEADCIYVDIYSARNLSQLTILTANAITEYYGSSVKDFLNKIAVLIKAIGATLSFNDDGKPKLNFGIGNMHEQTKNLTEIFKFLERSKRKVLLCFDEFQSIRNFPEKNAEAVLRTMIQDCRNINFIFSGSNKGILESMFTNSTSPFYQSTQYMFLKEIDNKEYLHFIREKFAANNTKVSDKNIHFILEICRTHTYYVQYLCNQLFSKGVNINNKVINNTIEEIIKENEPVYYSYFNLLTPLQWQLVSAIAKEKTVIKPFSSEFLLKHNLKSSSSIQRALKNLTGQEVIVYYNQQYMISDLYFSLWLAKNIL